MPYAEARLTTPSAATVNEPSELPPLLPFPEQVDGLPLALAPLRLLRSEEAAQLLGLQLGTLRTWRSRTAERGPRAVLLGGAVRYRHRDLEEWLATGMTGGVVGAAAGDLSEVSYSTPAVSLLDVDEAALLLSLASQTLRGWRAKRAPIAPPVLVRGGWVRYSVPLLLAWIDELVEAHPGEAPRAVAKGAVEASRRGRYRRGHDQPAMDGTVGPF